MPYFSWTGIDITGKVYRGKRCARNKVLLAAELLDNQLALIACKELRNWFFLARLSYKQLSQINSQLSLLLESGMRLNQSLELMSGMSFHKTLSPLLADCARSIQEGESLHKSLEPYAPLINPLMISVLAAAEQTGDLAQACRMLAAHYHEQNTFAEHMRNSLLLPLITVFLFLISSFGIFVYVIPRFEHLFAIINKNPGKLTQSLFSISAFLRSGRSLGGLLLAIGLAGGFSVLLWFKKRETNFLDKLFIRIPLVGNVVTRSNSLLFLQALGLLVQNSIPLVDALKVAANVVTNKVLKEHVACVAAQVESGVSFSQACSKYPDIFFKHAQALFAIGEASGSLGSMIHNAAGIGKAEFTSLLNKLVKGIPIVCLLLLGVLIGFLVIAIYAPLLTLAHVVN